RPEFALGLYKVNSAVFMTGTLAGTLQSDSFQDLAVSSVQIPPASMVMQGTHYTSLAGTLSFDGTGITVAQISGNDLVIFNLILEGTKSITLNAGTWGYITLPANSFTSMSGTATVDNAVESIDNPTSVPALWRTLYGDTPQTADGSISRTNTDDGAFPLDFAWDAINSDMDYRQIYEVGAGFFHTMNNGASSTIMTVGMTTTNPDAWVQDYVGGNTVVGYMNRYISKTGGDWSEAEVNAETLQFACTGYAYGTYFYMYGASKYVKSYLWPEARVYSLSLDILGTAGAEPAVDQFYITVEGATSTARRQSRLMVSQTDFYRWDGGATLTDIAGGATASTVTDTIRWDNTRFNGKHYFTNGVDDVYRYPDGSDEVEDLGAGFQGYTIASFIGRLFLGRTTESATLFPDRVRWSIIEDDSDWAGTGSGYIDLNDTDGEVVKLLPLGG
ncbi:unnamed protein product, partial [marine sediment metagenome]